MFGHFQTVNVFYFASILHNRWTHLSVHLFDAVQLPFNSTQFLYIQHQFTKHVISRHFIGPLQLSIQKKFPGQ